MSKMNLTRRQALMSSLFGAGALGLRALATGLPLSLIVDPRRALADGTTGACGDASKAQFIIFQTSGNGDAINASVPGTYEDAQIVHSPDPSMAPAQISIAGQTYTAATPWATLANIPGAGNVLDRTTFWHLMTSTPVHPKEPEVLELMGATQAGEMLPSILAKQLAPCLGTIQTQPIALGATNPSEALQFGGQALPVIPPIALKATLTNPSGEITKLQPLRDQTLNQLYDVYKNSATPAQRAYIDSLVVSQEQVRGIRQDLLNQLASIKDNFVPSQILAAITLIQMKVTPVITIHIPFSGDNHRDNALATETAQTVGDPKTPQTVTGVLAISQLMQALAAAGLQDQVTFMSLNVFGRTLGPDPSLGNGNGRQHNQNHQVSITIGKPFRPGVIGAVAAMDPNNMLKDYGATSIDSKTGNGGPGGDIAAVDTLASFGKTILAGVGVDAGTIDGQVRGGTVISGALA
jgi:hypothetical protein